MTALVVDEVALVRIGLATVLEGIELDVRIQVEAETPSGREAAELVATLGVDLVVIGAPADMPVVEAVRRVRVARDDVAIVALLGTGQVGSVAAVVEAGANGVARRSAPADDLAEAFRAVASGGRFVASSLSAGLLGRLETAPSVGGASGGEGAELLTFREREVLALLAGGATNREIALRLSVTLATVKSHLVHVYAKLEVRNRQQALSRAVALGLLV
jgi:DNA-binding NarL/FixJ family response regulator